MLLLGCKTNEKLAVENEIPISYKQTSTHLNLKAPINSADEFEHKKEVYKNNTYNLLQREWDKFKDNAPYIEIIEGGKRERLWFSSSRADDQFFGKKKTNHYQQIYYCERELGEGLNPNEGWSEPQLFIVSTDNPFYQSFIDQFNESTKGAVTLSNEEMIFSCDLILEGGNSEFKDLWEISRVDDQFVNPKPIMELSHENTWESQPSISSNGKHLFFVSNRKVLADGTVLDSCSVNDFNIFYSFKNDGKWDKPILVDEIATASNEVTPSLRFDDKKLYYSSNRSGNYNVYEVDINLNSTGGYTIAKESEMMFSGETIDITKASAQRIDINDEHHQQYPFYYYNPQNNKIPRAIFWASNAPGGYGSYDLYACSLPYVIQYEIDLVDQYPSDKITSIESPFIKIEGFVNTEFESSKASIDLYSGLNYSVKGGSYACEENGTFLCDIDDKYVFVGYSKIKGNPSNKFIHDEVLNGAEVNSKRTSLNDSISFEFVKSDTIIKDSIFITKAWLKKPFCPGKLNIEPKHKSIAYFQTGFWEVNTTANLKRDLAALHEGFEAIGGDIYNPLDGLKRNRSDYKAMSWENPLYPVIPNDGYTYSIANARWIELHPNNYYWGDRLGFNAHVQKRMEGRTKRINDYISYAQKVDENLENLIDTIQYNYIDLLDQHKNQKPKLLIEIFAVSDEREILRGWYIGETVEYRGSDYLEAQDSFTTESVKIIPPEIDEKNKVLTQLTSCSINLNSDGNNGTKLGLSLERTDQNTNLSRLRAWYGYKEVYERLAKTDKFKRYLDAGKVALPDNDLNYKDAEIIVITRGKREDGDIKSPKNAYPFANNPSGNGFYDYDKIRRIEIQTRLLFDNYDEVGKDYCCDPSEE